MTYSYDSSSGEGLRIQPSTVKNLTRLTVTDYQDQEHSVVVPNEEAPNAARALLEESGVKPSTTASLDCPEHYERRALAHLQQARILRERRDAEAAAAQRERNRLKRIEGGLTEALSDEEAIRIPQDVLDRMVRWVADTYEKDQEKADAAAYRTVLNHLDTEPPHNTRWGTTDRLELWHDGRDWVLSNMHGEGVGRFDWDNLPPTVFPLREAAPHLSERQKPAVIHSSALLDETHRDRRWKDSRGLVWAFHRTHWYYLHPNGEKHVSTPHNFPWTEVWA